MLSALSATDYVVYSFLFITLYFQVFLAITFLKRREFIREQTQNDLVQAAIPASQTQRTLPSVEIIVPVFNEERTVSGTVQSLLALDYPADKLVITIVDDGSTDNTWSHIQQYANHPQIRTFQKENGGKHTALNFALSHSSAEIVGCLDADSFVESHTLKKLVRYFDDPETMAVTPAMKIHQPTTVMQKVQSLEYKVGVLLKKIYEQLDAIHVTPGPFSLFRKRVFNELGLYKKAHNTEDMEIAMRMQSNHYKIRNCPTAYVFTCGPKTLRTLYKQRVRWTYGFIKNAIDYRHLFLNPKYGNIGMLTIPVASVGIIGLAVVLGIGAVNLARSFYNTLQVWKTIGFNPELPSIFHSWFYYQTSITTFVTIALLGITLSFIFTAKYFVEGKARIDKEFVLYMILYPFIAPLWVLKSMYNAALSKKTSWR